MSWADSYLDCSIFQCPECLSAVYISTCFSLISPSLRDLETCTGTFKTHRWVTRVDGLAAVSARGHEHDAFSFLSQRDLYWPLQCTCCSYLNNCALPTSIYIIKTCSLHRIMLLLFFSQRKSNFNIVIYKTFSYTMLK